MKNKIVIIIFLLFLLNVINKNAFAETTSVVPTLSVNGNGEVKAKPDIVSLSISVVTRGKTAAEAASSNASLAQKLISTLQAQGIAENDLQTSNISINPIYKQNQSGIVVGDSQIVGYEANNQVQVKIRKISDVGHIIDVVSLAGNFTISGVNFGLDKSDTFEELALQKAVADAKRKADIVAEAAGKTVTGIKSISVGSAVAFSESKFAGAAASDFSTPVLPGELSVSSNVFVEYFLDEN